MKVLCFGSLNIDYTYKVDHFVKKGETLSSESLKVFSGGKGLNQSIALAKAGADIWHAGAIGSDGIFLVKELEKAGVNTEYITVLENVRTGNAIIQNDKEGDNCIILYGGANHAITKEQVNSVLEHFHSGDFLVLQNEINELPYIMEQAHKKDMKIVLNPSPMNDRIFELPLAYVNYFVLNEIEAGQLLDMEIKEGFDGKELSKKLLERFPEAAIVLTLGSDGSVYLDKQNRVCQSAFRVKTVDTSAAGDTFTGFFIGGILKKLSVGDAMEMASKAAAIAVSRAGAAPSSPLWKEAESF